MASDEITALLDHLEIDAKERQIYEEAFSRAKSDVHILVTGKTGTGKSQLVNALTGAIVAREEASLDPESTMVTKYEALTQDGYTINVWDSPGLFDGSSNERDSVRSMKEKCGDKIDMLLYCIDMSAPRADVHELSSVMGILTEALGKGVWNHAMIVLTFANVVAERIAKEVPKEKEVEKFQDKIEEWKVKVWSALERAGAKPHTIAHIPIEPAGQYRIPHLPDRIHWLGYLWLQFLFYIKEEAKLAILMTNQNRIRSSEYLKPTGTEIDGVNLLIVHLESCKNTLWWKKYNAVSKVKAYVENTGGGGGQIISKFCAHVIKKMLQEKVRDMEKKVPIGDMEEKVP